MTGEPVVNTLVCFVLFCMRGCGCLEHPAFPAPSFTWVREKSCKTSGAWRGEIAEVCRFFSPPPTRNAWWEGAEEASLFKIKCGDALPGPPPAPLIADASAAPRRTP